MQQFLIRFLFICFTVFWGHAQNDVLLESLKKQFQNEKNEINKVILALDISEKINYSSLDDVQHYASKALEIASKQKDYKNCVKANQFLGNVFIIKGDYKKATQYFEHSKKIYQEELTNDFSGIVKTFGSLGIIASEQSNYNKALEYYLQGKQIAEKNKLEDLEIILNNNIGVIYKSTKRYKEALQIFDQTQKLQHKKENGTRGITLTNIATIYEQLNNNVLQKKYLDLAQIELQKANDDRAKGEWNNNMGVYFFKKSDLEKAENHWNQALKHFETIQDQFGSFDTHFYLAQLKQKQYQIENALQFAQKAQKLAKDIKVLEHQAKIEKLLSELYESQNNLSKSLYHAKAFQVLQDSLVNQENIRKTTELEMNFAFEKDKIKHQEEMQKVKNKQWFWVLALIILGLLFGIWYVNKKKEQQKQQLALENQLLDYKQKALHLQMNPHFVFNCLAAISSYIMQNEKEEAVKYLAMFSKLMRFTLESSKENWISIDKEIASLNQYLKLEQLRLNRIFDFSITKDATIEEDMLLPPMLIQPLVENAIIHGILPKQAKGQIKIHFVAIDNQIIIEVIDNGIGIEISKEQKKNQVKLHKSLAISIIKERLEMIEKTSNQKTNLEYCQINAGTKVKIELPVKY